MCLFGGLHKKDSAKENGNFENSKSHKLKMWHRDRDFLQKISNKNILIVLHRVFTNLQQVTSLACTIYKQLK